MSYWIKPMEIGFLKTLVIIFGVSASVIFLLHKLRIPSIVGFLTAGVLLGPHGFGLIRDIHEVELLAEIGIILLLFTVGLEISLKNLKRIRSTVLGGGFSQVLLTFLATAAIAYPFLQRWNTSLFAGFLVALSSTAIVMKMLFDRGEIDSPHGRLSIGILIFQDLCVPPSHRPSPPDLPPDWNPSGADRRILFRPGHGREISRADLGESLPDLPLNLCDHDDPDPFPHPGIPLHFGLDEFEKTP